MGDKISGRNFPHNPHQQGRRKNESRYNTAGYYQPNRELGNIDDEQRFPEGENDNLNTQYDDLNTSKQEDYKGGGYYGSNYGSISELNRGRDYERNAGYRENYNRLPTGQWPEIERAERSRGMDIRQRDLEARGVHRGKGPRSYQRSDMRIREDINDLLLEDPYIDATDIEVAVEKGEVILTGVVEDRNIKRRAEDMIEQVSGVRQLENRLRTKIPGGQAVNIRNSNQH
jgi:hypothetical protein